MAWGAGANRDHTQAWKHVCWHGLACRVMLLRLKSYHCAFRNSYFTYALDAVRAVVVSMDSRVPACCNVAFVHVCVHRARFQLLKSLTNLSLSFFVHRCHSKHSIPNMPFQTCHSKHGQNLYDRLQGVVPAGKARCDCKEPVWDWHFPHAFRFL